MFKNKQHYVTASFLEGYLSMELVTDNVKWPFEDHLMFTRPDLPHHKFKYYLI